MKKNDKYYLIRITDDNELDVKEYTKEELDNFFNKEDLNEYFDTKSISFRDEFPKNSEWEYDKLVLIKGSVITPEKIDIVTKWRL